MTPEGRHRKHPTWSWTRPRAELENQEPDHFNVVKLLVLLLQLCVALLELLYQVTRLLPGGW
jgi:hypothetical protein